MLYLFGLMGREKSSLLFISAQCVFKSMIIFIHLSTFSVLSSLRSRSIFSKERCNYLQNMSCELRSNPLTTRPSIVIMARSEESSIPHIRHVVDIDVSIEPTHKRLSQLLGSFDDHIFSAVNASRQGIGLRETRYDERRSAKLERWLLSCNMRMRTRRREDERMGMFAPPHPQSLRISLTTRFLRNKMTSENGE